MMKLALCHNDRRIDPSSCVNVKVCLISFAFIYSSLICLSQQKNDLRRGNKIIFLFPFIIYAPTAPQMSVKSQWPQLVDQLETKLLK